MSTGKEGSSTDKTPFVLVAEEVDKYRAMTDLSRREYFRPDYGVATIIRQHVRRSKYIEFDNLMGFDFIASLPAEHDYSEEDFIAEVRSTQDIYIRSIQLFREDATAHLGLPRGVLETLWGTYGIARISRLRSVAHRNHLFSSARESDAQVFKFTEELILTLFNEWEQLSFPNEQPLY